MPQIAVIILSYNNSSVTLNCVKSIQNSTYQDRDIYIIDNHSPDGSYNVLRNVLSDIPYVSLWDAGTNLGFAGGMNFGVKKAQENNRYDYYLFLNNDTVLENRCISELVRQAGNLGNNNIYAPIAYFLGTNLVYCGGMITYIPILFQFKYMGWPIIPHRRPYISRYLSGTCFLVHHSLFERIGGLDENLFLYGEDILFCEQVQTLGGRVYMVPGAKFWHIGSKVAGYITITKAYYLGRNIPHLVKVLSNNNPILCLITYIYLVSKILLAILCFRMQTAQAIFRGFHDYQNGVVGPQENQNVSRN
jgi:GT2 family glycosyltransferase